MLCMATQIVMGFTTGTPLANFSRILMRQTPKPFGCLRRALASGSTALSSTREHWFPVKRVPLEHRGIQYTVVQTANPTGWR